MTYPLEALLRPAYELRAAAVSGIAAAAVITKPAIFMLTPELAWSFAGLFLCHAGWRSCQGLRILRYRRNLRRLRPYLLTSEQMPWSPERLFLGKGFRWNQRHTQRLREARLPENQYLLSPGIGSIIGRYLGSSAPEMSSLGGDPAIHGVERSWNPMSG